MSSKSNRPTLKTISELTGLAVPTVSRALSGASDIGQKTRERVQAIADEIGYVPNRAGVRLRTGRSYVVALVLPTESDVMNLTARLINACASGLRGTRYHLNINPVFPDEDPLGPIKKIVETRAADGIIINQIRPEDPRVAYLLEQKFPFVTHGRSQWADNHDYYDFDNATYAEISVERLVERGRRKIWLLAPPMEHFYALEMARGAKAAADRLGTNLRIVPGATSDSSVEQIEAAVQNLFEEHGGADGIICASSASCMTAVSAVEGLGLTLSDVDFVSKEVSQFLQRFRTGILTQWEDAWEAGTFLSAAVLRRIENIDAPPLQKLEVPSRS